MEQPHYNYQEEHLRLVHVLKVKSTYQCVGGIILANLEKSDEDVGLGVDK